MSGQVCQTAQGLHGNNKVQICRLLRLLSLIWLYFFNTGETSNLHEQALRRQHGGQHGTLHGMHGMQLGPRARSLLQQTATPSAGRALEATFVRPVYPLSSNIRLDTCYEDSMSPCSSPGETATVAQLWCLHAGFLRASASRMEAPPYTGPTNAITQARPEGIDWVAEGGTPHNVLLYVACDSRIADTSPPLIRTITAPTVKFSDTASGAPVELPPDNCYEEQGSCGRAAADAFCKYAGLDMATAFTLQPGFTTTVLLRTLTFGLRGVKVRNSTGTALASVTCMATPRLSTARERDQPRVVVKAHLNLTSTRITPAAAAAAAATTTRRRGLRSQQPLTALQRAFLDDLAFALAQPASLNLTSPASVLNGDFYTDARGRVGLVLLLALPSWVSSPAAAFQYLAPYEANVAKVLAGEGVAAGASDLVSAWAVDVGASTFTVVGAALPATYNSTTLPPAIDTQLVVTKDNVAQFAPPTAPPAPPDLPPGVLPGGDGSGPPTIVYVPLPSTFDLFWTKNNYRNTIIIAAAVGGGTLLLLLLCWWLMRRHTRRARERGRYLSDADADIKALARPLDSGTASPAGSRPGTAGSKRFRGIPASVGLRLEGEEAWAEGNGNGLEVSPERPQGRTSVSGVLRPASAKFGQTAVPQVLTIITEDHAAAGMQVPYVPTVIAASARSSPFTSPTGAAPGSLTRGITDNALPSPYSGELQAKPSWNNNTVVAVPLADGDRVSGTKVVGLGGGQSLLPPIRQQSIGRGPSSNARSSMEGSVEGRVVAHIDEEDGSQDRPSNERAKRLSGTGAGSLNNGSSPGAVGAGFLRTSTSGRLLAKMGSFRGEGSPPRTSPTERLLVRPPSARVPPNMGQGHGPGTPPSGNSGPPPHQHTHSNSTPAPNGSFRLTDLMPGDGSPSTPPVAPPSLDRAASARMSAPGNVAALPVPQLLRPASRNGRQSDTGGGLLTAWGGTGTSSGPAGTAAATTSGGFDGSASLQRSLSKRSSMSGARAGAAMPGILDGVPEHTEADMRSSAPAVGGQVWGAARAAATASASLSHGNEQEDEEEIIISSRPSKTLAYTQFFAASQRARAGVTSQSGVQGPLTAPRALEKSQSMSGAAAAAGLGSGPSPDGPKPALPAGLGWAAPLPGPRKWAQRPSDAGDSVLTLNPSPPAPEGRTLLARNTSLGGWQPNGGGGLGQVRSQASQLMARPASAGARKTSPDSGLSGGAGPSQLV